MNDIIFFLREDLKSNINAQAKESFQRFFKEPVKYYGVKTEIVRKIAEKFWPQIERLDKEVIFCICEELFRSEFMEEAFVVAFWLPNYIEKLEPGDLATFKFWIEHYVDNWAKCDSLCNHTVGDLIQKFPTLISELKDWAKSKNRWLKRSAAVSLVIPARRGLFLEEALGICDDLLSDPDEMVQKGYGWLLKEESKMNQNEVFNFVVRNKRRMPRIALRYAVELMPETLREEAMCRSNL